MDRQLIDRWSLPAAFAGSDGSKWYGSVRDKSEKAGIRRTKYLSRVSSTAHVFALWQVLGSVRGDTSGIQDVCFLWASHNHLPGGRCVWEGGLPEGLPVGTGRWPEYGVSGTLYCSGVSVRRRKSGECWSSIVMMSTNEGLLAPVFLTFMVRNLSSTPVVVVAVDCSGVGA